MARKRGQRRADAARNDASIVEAASRLLEQSPSASLAEVAAAAGVSRSTLYRRFSDRETLLEAVAGRESQAPRAVHRDDSLPTGRLGRQRPIPLDAIHVFDAVPPAQLPEQLVAEAQRIAEVPVALYVLDIDGSHLLHMAGPDRLGALLAAPLAIGPELDASGISMLRGSLAELPGVELFALWLRGRALGALVTFGRPRQSLTELARQAAAALTLADRYTDVFATAQRRKQPQAAAEIQQSLLPPRIARISHGEVAGNVLPSYEVAGDWYDVVENRDGVWLTLADGLGGSTRAAASSAVALGALRSARRSGAAPNEALLVMHQTLSEMPGRRAEMTAIGARWDPTTHVLDLHNAGHVVPFVARAGGEIERPTLPPGNGLGGRATPRLGRWSGRLSPDDRLLIVSDGVLASREAGAGPSTEALERALSATRQGSASDTVREVHRAVLDGTKGDLEDDATAVCLLVG